MSKDLIQIARGTKATKPKLNDGEFGLCTDTKELYIGHSTADIRVATENDIVGAVRSESFSNEPIDIDTETIPATSIIQDSTHRFVSDTEKNQWVESADLTVVGIKAMNQGAYDLLGSPQDNILYVITA